MTKDRAFPQIVFSLAFVTLLFVSTPCLLAAENAAPRASTDRSGIVQFAENSVLHVITDLGSVTVQPLPPNSPPVVRYSVHIETDARQPLADTLLERYSLNVHNGSNGVFINGNLPPTRLGVGRGTQFWVQFVIYVPASSSLEVSTGVGDIETADFGGRVTLITEGGNIRTGNIGYARHAMDAADRLAAKLESKGGHITVRDISGDLDAYTAGGHIVAGNVTGSAKLRSGGGHIRAGRIQGTAQLETEGGNITVGEAGMVEGVRTGGGQIDFGEVHGSVHAQTYGGGIRVMYVSGPMEVETSGGSVCLTKVVNAVRAFTGGGTITAWIAPDTETGSRIVHLPGASQLGSSSGDIVVFLPRNIAMNIDATLENGGPAHLEADPALPLNIQTRLDGQVRVLGELNGGGPTLRLRTASGKIRLQYLDAEMALRQSLLNEQRQRISQRLEEAGYTPESALLKPSPNPFSAASSTEAKGDWIDAWISRLEVTFTGGVHEDPEEFKKRLLNAPPPDYPQFARRAGLQGLVKLQVRVKTDGTISVDRVLEGEPALVDAAVASLRDWRAQPDRVSGKNVEVISTVSFNFQLRK